MFVASIDLVLKRQSSTGTGLAHIEFFRHGLYPMPLGNSLGRISESSETRSPRTSTGMFLPAYWQDGLNDSAESSLPRPRGAEWCVPINGVDHGSVCIRQNQRSASGPLGPTKSAMCTPRSSDCLMAAGEVAKMRS